MSFEYKLLDPPFAFKTLAPDDMTDDQAEEYFNWYILQEESRISLLKAAYAYDNGSDKDLDNSPESLVPLWKWVSQYVETKSDSSDIPEVLKNVGVTVTSNQLKVSSLGLAMDLGFYLAKLLKMIVPDTVKWI